MKKILIPAVLAIALIVGAFGATGAFAQDPPGTQKTALLSRVATILGIDEQRLTDAFTQAAKELHNEQIDQAVADGRITQEYANWLKARPDNGPMGPGFGRGGHGGFGGRFGGMPRLAPAPAPTPSQ